jgi:hypothetical protein
VEHIYIGVARKNAGKGNNAGENTFKREETDGENDSKTKL